MTDFVELMGAPGSPYTRKMLALMRYRRIPYQVRWQGNIIRGENDKRYPKPKVSLLPTFYFADGDDGALVAATDSSPILRRLEREHAGRSVIPTDAVLAFINWLLEDYADEWLTKAMFHYRWQYPADIEKAGEILPRWHATTTSDADIAPISKMIRERQISRLSYVGSNETTKPTIETSFARMMSALNEHLQVAGFILGSRPASCDFAFYGQLTQLALFDPTPAKLVLEKFPRVYAWVDIMEDLSGREARDEDWLDASDILPPTLLEILREVAKVYLPYLHANAVAVANGDEQLQCEIDGRAWQQTPFPYQAKCLAWIKQEYENLNSSDKTRLANLTPDTGLTDQL